MTIFSYFFVKSNTKNPPLLGTWSKRSRNSAPEPQQQIVGASFRRHTTQHQKRPTKQALQAEASNHTFGGVGSRQRRAASRTVGRQQSETGVDGEALRISMSIYLFWNKVYV
jgi:hypothetical protein